MENERYREYLARLCRNNDMSIEDADKLAISQSVKQYYEEEDKEESKNERKCD